MKVEICASNFESALAAQEGGADRIELCSQLSVGGLTPSRELIRNVVTEIDIPVHVLIRPRAGDFSYSDSNLNHMMMDILFCKEVGCDGVVSGVLTSEGNLDALSTKKLIEASHDMHFTFHRAFDICNQPHAVLEDLIVLGVNRILSSGRQVNAISGLDLLKELDALTEDNIEIMPGAGIDIENIGYFRDAGFASIHLSAIKKTQPAKSFFETGVEGVSDLETIQKVVDLAK